MRAGLRRLVGDPAGSLSSGPGPSDANAVQLCLLGGQAFRVHLPTSKLGASRAPGPRPELTWPISLAVASATTSFPLSSARRAWAHHSNSAFQWAPTVMTITPVRLEVSG